MYNRSVLLVCHESIQSGAVNLIANSGPQMDTKGERAVVLIEEALVSGLDSLGYKYVGQNNCNPPCDRKSYSCTVPDHRDRIYAQTNTLTIPLQFSPLIVTWFEIEPARASSSLCYECSLKTPEWILNILDVFHWRGEHQNNSAYQYATFVW